MTTTIESQKGGVLDGLVRPFGVAAAGLLTAFAGFQTALALGVPWGAHVWGGSFTGELPTAMRFAGVGAAVVLVGMATVVLSRAHVTQRFATWRRLTGLTWAIAESGCSMASSSMETPARVSDRSRHALGSNARPNRTQRRSVRAMPSS